MPLEILRDYAKFFNMNFLLTPVVLSEIFICIHFKSLHENTPKNILNIPLNFLIEIPKYYKNLFRKILMNLV